MFDGSDKWQTEDCEGARQPPNQGSTIILTVHCLVMTFHDSIGH